MSAADTVRRIGIDGARRVERYCKATGLQLVSALLLLDFAETPEGARFAQGGSLKPQFPTTTHTRGWARMNDYYDEEDEWDEWQVK